MATTFTDLKNEVYMHVYGYARDQEQVTYVSTAVGTTTATSIVVGDSTQVSRGLLEIEDELLWVQSTDATTNTLTIAPWGRGYLGTTAATHAQNVQVTSNPRFPRYSISRTINEAILAVYPQLFGVAQTDLTYSASQSSYELPAAADRVLSARWELPGPSNEWERISRWRETLDGASNVNEIVIDAGIVPGRTVRVVYAKKTTELSAGGDLLTATGLAESARDVIVFGAVARLLMLSESGRLQSRAMESSELLEDVPPGTALTAGRRYMEMYQMRLLEERKRLLERYPPAIHLTR